MTHEPFHVPAEGAAITFAEGAWQVPNNPIIPFIEGDGTGPDIWRATQAVLDAAVRKAYQGERQIAWVEVLAGEKAHDTLGDWLPERTLEMIKRYRVAIKGPLTTPVGGGFRSLNVALRKDLDLYACIRPVRWFAGVPSPVKRPDLFDVVIFRENIEDIYAGIEWQRDSAGARQVIDFLAERFGIHVRSDSGIGIKPISEFASKRLVRSAIRYALQKGRKRVTLVHKGNIQKYTEGAFRDWGYEVAREEFGDATVTWDELQSRYGGKLPEGKILIQDSIADIMFQHLLLRPSDHEVLATTNLNGDYLSDAAAAIVGGIGIAPGANVGDGFAVFEATHGTAPKYANQDKVNPGSLILSGVMMLEHLGWQEAADRIVAGFAAAIGQGTVTYDFARQMQGAREVTTSEFAKQIIANL